MISIWTNLKNFFKKIFGKDNNQKPNEKNENDDNQKQIIYKPNEKNENTDFFEVENGVELWNYDTFLKKYNFQVKGRESLPSIYNSYFEPVLKALPTTAAVIEGSQRYILKFSPEVMRGLKTGEYTLPFADKYQDGYYVVARSKDMTIVEHGRVGKAGLSPIGLSVIVWQALTIITLTKHLSDINKQLQDLNSKVDDIKKFLEEKEFSKIYGYYDYLKEKYEDITKGYLSKHDIHSIYNTLENMEKELKSSFHLMQTRIDDKLNEILNRKLVGIKNPFSSENKNYNFVSEKLQEWSKYKEGLFGIIQIENFINVLKMRLTGNFDYTSEKIVKTQERLKDEKRKLRDETTKLFDKLSTFKTYYILDHLLDLSLPRTPSPLPPQDENESLRRILVNIVTNFKDNLNENIDSMLDEVIKIEFLIKDALDLYEKHSYLEIEHKNGEIIQVNKLVS